MEIVFLITRPNQLFKAEGFLHLMAQCVQNQKGPTYYFVAPTALKAFTPAGSHFKKWPRGLSYLPVAWAWALFKQFSTLKKARLISLTNPAILEKIGTTPFLAPCYSVSTIPHPALQFYVLGQLPSEKEFLYLLKAFSLFKKRQQSSMKLIIPAQALFFVSTYSEKLATYKYRDAVQILQLNSLEKQQKEEALSYALIALDPQGDSTIWQQKSIQLKVPLLTFSSADVQSLADQMMLIYKDEAFRASLISSTSSQSACVSLSSHPIYYEYLHYTN